jgi:HAD superfamily hydrolase (TIGR01549 family)
MNLTILLDLDNTLLINDMDRFLPAYLKKLSTHLVQFSPEQVINNLMLGTNKMIKKKLPANTLEETFDSVFYPALGIKKEQVAEQLDVYYRDIFPTLQPLTHPIPEATQLVDFLTKNGFKTVIATNPLFPRQAILHRLNWAGFSADKLPFTLITSYETFHFSKPHPAYFAEILAQLGWPEQPAVVIGDNLNDEIIPASQFGLPAYWVNSGEAALPAGLHPLCASGPLSGVFEWINKVGQAAPETAYNSQDAILAILKSTPAALDTFKRQIHPETWQTRYQENGWSFGEIICHLRDVDCEVNLPRMKMIAQGENPFLPGIVTDVWSDERNYLNQDPTTAFADFIQARTELIKLLAGLDTNGWNMPARHAIFGPTSLIELAAFITTHDRTHVHQAWEVVRQFH